MIEVKQTSSDRFEVTVADGTTTRHEVTMSANDFERLGQGRTPNEVIHAAFRFLLDREPKESILRSFDVSVIGRYFPEFERTLSQYF